jgi:pimeloyl-ACP methyl ester carboxylesterase
VTVLRWVIILSAFLTGSGAFSFAESSAPSAGSLASLVHQFLDVGDSDEAERLLQGILSDEQASIEAVSRIIREGRTYEIRPIGMLPSEQIVVRGRTYPLSLFVPASYETTKSYALLVCLHGYGFTGEEYVERWRTRLGEDYLLACPTYPSGAWFARHAEELVLETIRDIRRQYHIDPDRIFLTGMSNGGIGAWLIGMHHAPLFAGIAPMASGLDDVLMPFLANLRSTPLYIIHGAKDQVMPVDLSRSIAKELDALGYPYVYREHQRVHPIAGGHYFPKEEVPDLVAWFDHRRREPLPTSVTLVRDASHFQPFNWVRIDSTDPIAAFSDDLVDKRDEWIKRRVYARLDASITGSNRIEVRVEHVQRYGLFLNEQLIDFSKPLTVLTNGRLSFEGTVTPSVETLLRQARLRQDPERLFSVHLTIAIAKPVP